MELKCPNCRISISQGDIYCSKCGIRLQTDNDDSLSGDSFNSDILNLLDALHGFRTWMDQRKKTNIRFMKVYKKRLDELGIVIKQFKLKYHHSEKGRMEPFELVQEIFTCFRRPVRFMETELRPSVGMGVWQERWMMITTVEDYLAECCRESDRLFDELNKNLPFLRKVK